MFDFDEEDSDGLVVDFGEKAEVADAVAPVFAEVAGEGFAVEAGVGGMLEIFINPMADLVCYGFV